MLSKLKKALFIVFLIIYSSSMFIGYASLTDSLKFSGDAMANVPDYDGVLITDIETVSNTMSIENTQSVMPTNLFSMLNGKSGQTVVYKVTARNYSKSKTFIYTGVLYDSAVFEDINKLTISVSQDQNNSKPLTNNVNNSVHEGTPIPPNEEFVFYVTYTLKDELSSGNVLINYNFESIDYSVTYLDNNETYAVDYVTNNEVEYIVKSGLQNNNLVFAGWVNVNGVVVNSIPAGNNNSYTLSASWENIHIIIFADVNGNVLYQEQFTDSSTQLSSEGQATVDRILAELNAEAAKEHMKVSWEDYQIKGAKQDIHVKAIYAYDGVLNLVPVYEQPDDGIVDYYKVQAVDTLPTEVVVPGSVGGIPVKVVERIANTEGDNDWNNYAEDLEKITIGEGVERLEWNSLAYTPNLATVVLPNTIKYMAKNTFSRNFGDDRKAITIQFNGTKAEWKALLSNSDKNWDGGLKSGTKVQCTDGYFALEGWLITSWKEY